MNTEFNRIGILAKVADPQAEACVLQLINYLEQCKKHIYLEQDTWESLAHKQYPSLATDELGKNCDLIIVVGGDGSLLKAARAVANAGVPVLGVHRGRLGFLTDIGPQHMEASLAEIFAGKYISEQRSLLGVKTKPETNILHTALNDVVIYNGDIARLIEFEIYVDNNYVSHQRADGLIIATPTGSTAYALSGGGPILYPTLKAITLVPMFPHTLSARPIVIHESSTIKLVLSTYNKAPARVSCDGQIHFTLEPGAAIEVLLTDKPLQLLHPSSYNYFAVLREKLGWNLNSSSDRYSQKSLPS